jgi:hypothetical protein
VPIASAAMAVLAACAGDDAPVVLDASRATASTSTAPPASVLAPSQTTPDTIAAPELPPPCDPSVLRFSSPAPLADGALAIRIENVGTVRCEATFDESPIVDQSMEPDVWLDAGGAGELIAAVDATSCAAPGPVESIGLIVNGAAVAVVVEPFDACTIVLTALYPL